MMVIRLISTIFFIQIVKVITSEANETNENRIPAIRLLDGNLRKALLKALNDLESEPRNAPPTIASAFSQSPNGQPNHVQIKDYNRAPLGSVVSYLVDGASTDSTKAASSLNANHVQPLRITDIKAAEDFIASASTSFNSDTNRKKISHSDANSIVFTTTTTAPSLSSSSSSSTPPAPPPPTTTTEENEAKAEDVQFFAAPLVAAFTVHHDASGLPKSVEPIFKSPISKKTTAIGDVKKPIDLEAKQRQLERQLAEIQKQKQQQQQQDYQVFHNRQQQQQQQQQAFKTTSEISFEPSIAFHPANLQLEMSQSRLQQQQQQQQQQLPVKATHNFQRTTLVTPEHPFPFQYPLITNSFYNNAPVQPEFFGNFLQAPPQQQQRFFRSNSVDFSIVPSVPGTVQVQPPFFIHPHHQQQSANNFDNLLTHSGITRGNQQEDFNIVSKVLSLDHFGRTPYNIDNFVGGSQRVEKRVPIPKRTRTVPIY